MGCGLRFRMKYRITLDNNNGYEAVIFREFKEGEGVKGQSIMMKKAASIAIVYSALNNELSGQSAFTIKRIEEIPSDKHSSGFSAFG